MVNKMSVIANNLIKKSRESSLSLGKIPDFPMTLLPSAPCGTTRAALDGKVKKRKEKRATKDTQ